jgi:hypothetical protein
MRIVLLLLLWVGFSNASGLLLPKSVLDLPEDDYVQTVTLPIPVFPIQPELRWFQKHDNQFWMVISVCGSCLTISTVNMFLLFALRRRSQFLGRGV